MWLGVDYYPEQWDEALLDSDLDTIVELGCDVIRIAEFAWNKFENEEKKNSFEGINIQLVFLLLFVVYYY